MTPAVAVMLDCHRAGVALVPDSHRPGRVLFAPEYRLTPELAARLRDHRHRVTRLWPDGWTPDAWAWRLRQLADRCEGTHPERAAELREWSAFIYDRTDTKTIGELVGRLVERLQVERKRQQ